MEPNTQVRKYQWSKFSTDKSEQYVVRTDSWEELVEGIGKVKGIAPTTQAFPDDEGYSAHSEAQTQAPVCGIHGNPMTQRQGQYGMFWSCGKKNADGTWCKFKPGK